MTERQTENRPELSAKADQDPASMRLSDAIDALQTLQRKLEYDAVVGAGLIAMVVDSLSDIGEELRAYEQATGGTEGGTP